MGHILRSEKGFTLVGTVVAAGILGGLAYAASTVFQSSLKSATHVNVSVQAETIRRNLVNNLNNDAAWANTVAANPALACLAPGSAPCAAGMPVIRNILVKNAGPHGGGLVFDGSNPANGFSGSGAPCSRYKATGDDQCPFRVDLSITLLCSGAGDCRTPQVVIRHVLHYSPKTEAFRVAFNAGRHDFEFTRGQSTSAGGGPDPRHMCEATFGGIFDPVTSACDLRKKTCLDMGGHWSEPAGPCDLSAGRPKYQGMEKWPSYVFCTDVNQSPLIAELVGRNNYLMTGQAPDAHPSGVYLVAHACDGTTCEPRSFVCPKSGECHSTYGLNCPKLALDGREVQR